MELITEGIRLRIDMEALKGKYDKLTEKAMYFVGTIDQAVERIRTLQDCRTLDCGLPVLKWES